MIRREISGPQNQFERGGGMGYRDVRPLTVRLAELLGSQFSGLALGTAAGVAYFYPAAIDLLVPASLAYAGWVMRRRVKLPLRLPRSANCLDWNYPSPVDRKPQQAAGSIFLGIDQVTGQELWITNEDGRQHGTIPGTTGAGKTTAILSLLANSLTHGSGFVLVDGKADNKLYGEVMAMARRFGREDDVLVLNFLVASGIKQSNTFNPFAAGNADAIRELLVSQLGEQKSEDSNGVFRTRAVALIATITPVLVWMRDRQGVPINIETIRFALELRSIYTLAMHRIFLTRDKINGDVSKIQATDIPEEIIYPLKAYLGELPGYDISVPYNEQKGDEPSKQHGFALFYFTGVFSQLSVSLGHIFKVLSGDIDMRDVVLNRRILVVNLPALENSDDTLAALGKIVVASLRGMLAQLLGAKLEGDSKEIFSLKPGMGEGPFHVVFDEVAYYATNGMDRMLAMGRGLNIMFWLCFQEVSGIWARLGEKTASLLGNANLTIAMRQQDANRTREWIEKTGGETEVTQATSFVAGEAGQYREGPSAEVRKVNRVSWSDLQKLLEGEAIVMLGGRRVYAKLFYADVKADGPIRRNRPLILAGLPRDGSEAGDTVKDVIVQLEGGQVPRNTEPQEDPVLCAMIEAFKASTAPTAGGRIAAAIAAAGKAPRPTPANDDPPEPPVTTSQPMLEDLTASTAEETASAKDQGASPTWGVVGDKAAAAAITAIEEASGASSAEAARTGQAVAQVLAEATILALPEPPAMTSEDLAANLKRLLERVAA
ncbi:conjugal transfer protein TraG [Roseomonas nepalensis]|uniref:Conjugal transfer protein TraG n=1 Tax=Muricoccus nepalensis TaxID=1854500 RepID=A0A502G2Z1_9PROT|nr:type IV secretion system DNA-binding domain-containing protein [Roseomonas nepalensis]TPG55942.1 conjugal transfer protein TraG [Roseomonas nepalensis]